MVLNIWVFLLLSQAASACGSKDCAMLWKLAWKLAVLVLRQPSDPGSTFKCLAIYDFLGGCTAGFVSKADEISMISSSRSSSRTIPEATWFEMRCSIWCACSISEGHLAFPVGLDVRMSC